MKKLSGFLLANADRVGAMGLWRSLPGVYRQYAVCYTDFGEAYEKVIPNSRHRAVGKSSGKTKGIERFNCTLRQRVSRQVRDTLSFSKKLDNHIGAIWYARTSLQFILTSVGLPKTDLENELRLGERD